ncbi:MAG: hypothetical protein QOE90_2813 [Thermoplasmata archaeon]|nr:hypothetical protein [Thermoplasmata archaeon]
MRPILVALVALVLASSSLATAAEEGDVVDARIVAPGGVDLPGHTIASGPLLGAVLTRQGVSSAWVIHAASALVERHRAGYEQVSKVPGPVTSEEVSTWRVTNLSVTLASPQNETLRLGVEGSGEARLASLGPVVVKASGPNLYGEMVMSGGDDPGTISVDRDHVAWTGPSDLGLRGALFVGIYGYDATLAAAENVTREQTGEQPPPRPLPLLPPVLGAGEASDTWLVLHLTNATVRVEAASVQAALADLDAKVDGEVRVAHATGSVTTGRGSRSVDGPLVIGGEHTIHATPEPGEGNSPALRIEVARAPLPAAPLSASTRRAGLALLTLAGAAGASALVGVGARRTLLSAEWCAARADLAAERSRFRAALLWTRQALRRAPTSRELRANEGWFLEQVGRCDEALASYLAAADAESSLLAARLLARQGREAEAHDLVEAAAKTWPHAELDLEE